jgi:hypothetical protein
MGVGLDPGVAVTAPAPLQLPGGGVPGWVPVEQQHTVCPAGGVTTTPHVVVVVPLK